MDKKNTFIGSLLIAAAVLLMFFGRRQGGSPLAPADNASSAEDAAPAAAPATAADTGSQTAFAAVVPEHAGASSVTLQNHFIRVNFSNFGGAIRDVALLKYPAALGRLDPFVMNELHSEPMLAFVGLPGLDADTRYTLVAQTADSVTYRAVLHGEVEVTRSYRLSPDKVGQTDPYQIRCETTFRNLTDRPIAPMSVELSLGTAAPVSQTDYGRQLATGFSDGAKQTFYLRTDLQASGGMFGLGAHDLRPSIESPGPVVWAAVKNQFFTSILTPDLPAADMVTRRVKLFPALSDATPNAYGITGDAAFALPALPAHGTAVLGAEFYAGPNEYPRLSNTDVFKANQDRVMHFGWFRFFSELLLQLMTWIHSLVPGWGWGAAIISTTLLLKIVFLPLTLMAARSSRRMQKIQPEMKAIKEKFKDNAQKQQAATLELFKKHKVNPAGGCLPMLLPFPFFIGFFYMLLNAAEFRLAPFLWAKDLSSPDVVGHIYGFPIEVWPIIYGVLALVQMQLVPQPTMGADNSQAKMMRFMPVLYVWFYYRYSCALSLYSAVNALFMILQQLFVNRLKDDGDPAGAAVPAGSARALKNVTPGKKR